MKGDLGRGDVTLVTEKLSEVFEEKGGGRRTRRQDRERVSTR